MKRGLNPATYTLLAIAVLLVLIGGYWYWFVYRPVEGTISPSRELFMSECQEAVQDYAAWLQASVDGASACDASSRFRKPFCLASVTGDSASCADAAPDTSTACNAIAAKDKNACADNNYCLAYLGDDAGCAQLGNERLACAAAVRKDAAYFSSGESQSDCQDLASRDWAVTNHDAALCGSIANADLKAECLDTLSR
ncbi:hypothetical protein HY493_02285 [Candidatus Woesearchaeota archaeon]|nr:hypothetical protein [Candidatus Woesearchaeota archaeon]